MDTQIYPVPDSVRSRALIDDAGYREMYARSIDDNEAFWAEQAKRIDWIKPFSQIKDVSYAKDDLHIRWFHDGTLDSCHPIPAEMTGGLRAAGRDIAIPSSHKPFHGLFGDLRIYRRAVTAERVKELYQEGAPRFD